MKQDKTKQKEKQEARQKLDEDFPSKYEKQRNKFQGCLHNVTNEEHQTVK